MVFPPGTRGGKGGKSRIVASNGTTVWQADAGVEQIKIWDLPVNPTINTRPRVNAGEVKTIRLPQNTITLNGYGSTTCPLIGIRPNIAVIETEPIKVAFVGMV